MNSKSMTLIASDNGRCTSLKFLKLLSLFIVMTLMFSTLVTVSVRASSSGVGQQSSERLILRGTTSIGNQVSSGSSNGTNLELRPSSGGELDPRSGASSAIVATLSVPTADGKAVVTTSPGFSGFNGLTHRDQRLAGTGAYTNTQF